MEVNSQAEVSLLIDPDRSGCFPLSTRAFHVAQATRRELKKNIGSLVLFRNGEVRRIEGFALFPFMGNRRSKRL